MHDRVCHHDRIDSSKREIHPNRNSGNKLQEAEGQDQSQDQSRDPARAALSIRRETLLAIFLPPGEQHPQTFEILPVVFDLLAVLEDWTVPSEFVLGPESDELIRELADSALIEVRL